MGNGELVDSLIHDGLWCAFDAVHMGAGTEKYVGQVGGITREAQDELAAKSHERAAAAQKEGRFADEITPVSIPQRKGDPVIVDTDEGVRPGTTTESLGGLRPAFSKDGTITAGNASQISDGGAAVIVMSRPRPKSSAPRRCGAHRLRHGGSNTFFFFFVAPRRRLARPRSTPATSPPAGKRQLAGVERQAQFVVVRPARFVPPDADRLQLVFLRQWQAGAVAAALPRADATDPKAIR